MRIARFVTPDADPRYALVEEDELVVLTGDPLYIPGQPTGERIALDQVRLLAPVIPRSKIVGVGRNYAEHAAEFGNEVPSSPLLFLKPNTAVIGPDDPIVLPDFSHEVDHEAELAVVIGRMAKDISPEGAARVIHGYTCANDVSARDMQRAEPQWVRAKAFDGSCPLGPFIVTDLDPDGLDVTCTVNGEDRQRGNTSQMIFGVAELVSYISHVFTLLPGDVILTGTPAGVGRIESGDIVTVEVEGIGALRNPVVRR